MLLSDISVKRPVFATVISLLLIAFGIMAFDRLALREYPAIDPPVVTIDTTYRGAAANVVESRITEIIEQRIAGVEGIKFIESISEDGRSRVTIEFEISRDIDSAANDVRDRVFGILEDLPDEADPPEIQKVDSSEDVILWLNLSSDKLSLSELTDYAERYLIDRFSVLEGVATVRIGGGQRFAMRVWLDRVELAARGLTVTEVENALRAENIELPAGSIESVSRQFTVRVSRAFRTAKDFSALVLARGEDGYLVRLGDVARVELGTEEDRILFRGNGVAMVGIGIIKQSTANTIAVARAAKAEMARLNTTLPEGMKINQNYDSSVFVEGAVNEVYMTLVVAMLLVVFVIYMFLGNARATIVPAVTVPVSLIATFIVLYILDFSVNLFSLLGLILAIGMVVDDAIVVLENIYRRMEEYGETPLVASYRGTREVGFAVIATTLVVVAVFVPLSFLEGDLGRLFSEFALTIAAAVSFSSLVALSLCPMIASKVLKDATNQNSLTKRIDATFLKLRSSYKAFCTNRLRKPFFSVIAFLVLIPLSAIIYAILPTEYTVREDRGAFYLMVNGPEGASYSYMENYMEQIEKRLVPYLESGEAHRLLVRAPRGFGTTSFNTGIVVAVLADWSKRRSAWEIMDEISASMADLPGVRIAPVMRQGFGARTSKDVQFVIGGGTYDELARYRDVLLEKINQNNPGLNNIDWDYKESKPQLEVVIDYNRAAELGVTINTIGRTLETMLGSRRVTTYINDGEEYDVILEGERDAQRTPINMENIYVRSERSDKLIPLSNVVTLQEFGGSTTLNRYNRIRAITIDANLSEGLALGEALEYLEQLVKENLPESVIIDYKGQSRNFKYSGGSIGFVFILGLIVVFLVLAAQFESFIHPFVIMLTVPLAVAGGLLGLLITGGSLNLFTQIALIMLVGLATKNGILIVEFTNQLRDRGVPFFEAIIRASETRLRPILMTSITTIAGAIPLVFASGAGAETRQAIGIVVTFGMAAATVLTVWIIPIAYKILAANTGSPLAVTKQLEREEAAIDDAQG